MPVSKQRGLQSGRKQSNPDRNYDGGESYSAGQTGTDRASEVSSGQFSASTPQRGNRPALSLAPEADNFYTRFPFKENTDASFVTEDYNDLGAIDNNRPVPVRKDWDVYRHGWAEEPYSVYPNPQQSVKGTSDE